MATKTVILVLAVLAAAVAIADAVTYKRETRTPTHATFILPYYKTMPNGVKTLEFISTAVTPIIEAANQGLVVTGQLFSNVIGGLTSTLNVIETILTGATTTTTTTTVAG